MNWNKVVAALAKEAAESLEKSMEAMNANHSNRAAVHSQNALVLASLGQALREGLEE